MGFVLQFDAKDNILRGNIEGLVTDAILLDFYAELTRYIASHPPSRGILDFSSVTNFEASSGVIRQLAAAAPAFPPGQMRVFVVPKDLLFGMARMFQMLGEKTRPELHVVRTVEEAYELLQ